MPSNVVKKYRTEGAVVAIPLLSVIGYLYLTLGAHGEHLAKLEETVGNTKAAIVEMKVANEKGQESVDRKLNAVLDKLDKVQEQQYKQPASPVQPPPAYYPPPGTYPSPSGGYRYPEGTPTPPGTLAPSR